MYYLTVMNGTTAAPSSQMFEISQKTPDMRRFRGNVQLFISQASVCGSLPMVRLESGFFSENVIVPMMAERFSIRAILNLDFFQLDPALLGCQN